MPAEHSPLPPPLRRFVVRVMQEGFDRTQRLDPTFASQLDGLEGKTVAIHLEGLELWLYLRAADGRLQLDLDPPEGMEQPDATLHGQAAALLGMGLPELKLDAGPVRIEGDARMARALEQALKNLNPDWEQAFTRRFGDVLGHQMWRGLRALARQGRNTGRKLAEDGRDWLLHESRLVPHRLELESFYSDVDRLREATDRLEARLQRLEPKQEHPG